LLFTRREGAIASGLKKSSKAIDQAIIAGDADTVRESFLQASGQTKTVHGVI
jgi:hypothetical protein